MNRIGIISDTHGQIDSLVRVLKTMGEVDMLIHLGDGMRDLDDARVVPYLPRTVFRVAGNCDVGINQPSLLEVSVEPGLKLIMTHGHNLGVRTSTDRLYYMAAEKGAKIALYGHTHSACIDYGDIWLLNPGAVSSVMHPSWAILEKDGNIWKPSLERL